MTNTFLPYARHTIDASDLAAVNEALLSRMITRGPKVEAFEETLTNYCGAKYAVAFNSGTAALMAAYFAVETNSHDTIISTPNSFVATVGAGLLPNMTPVFVDIDRTNGGVDISQAIETINAPRSRGRPIFVPVHFAGIALDMERLSKEITQPDTVIIEDAAHAIGSCYTNGMRVGSCPWSQMTIFSFHAAKTITMGEGGAVTTNDPKLFERLRLFRNNGIVRAEDRWDYEVQAITGNYNVTEAQAALGLSQFQKLDSFIEKRRALIRLYRDKLRNVTFFSESNDARTAYHLCVAQIDFPAHSRTRDEVIESLAKAGIGAQVHYIPLYRHPVIKRRCGDLKEYFPEMERYFTEALTLPLFPSMTEADVERVVVALKGALGI